MIKEADKEHIMFNGHRMVDCPYLFNLILCADFADGCKEKCPALNHFCGQAREKEKIDGANES